MTEDKKSSRPEESEKDQTSRTNDDRRQADRRQDDVLVDFERRHKSSRRLRARRDEES